MVSLVFWAKGGLAPLLVSFVAAGVRVVVLETKKVEWGWRFVVLAPVLIALTVSLLEVIRL